MLRLGKRFMRAGAAGVGAGFLIVTGFAFWAVTAAHADNGSFKDDDIIIVDQPLHAWHGCYIGVSAGGNIDSSSATISAPVTEVANTSSDGLALGAYTGCNLQAGSLVLGIEGDINTASNDPHFFASARVRLGLTVTEQMLVYITGGYAVANQSYDVFASNGAGVRVSRSADGVAYGGGIEHALGDGNAFRVEAIHYDYDNNRDLLAGGFADVDQSHTVIRVGFTLSFSGGFLGNTFNGTDLDVIQ